MKLSQVLSVAMIVLFTNKCSENEFPTLLKSMCTFEQPFLTLQEAENILTSHVHYTSWDLAVINAISS